MVLYKFIVLDVIDDWRQSRVGCGWFAAFMSDFGLSKLQLVQEKRFNSA
jgi:hypothetical protein